MRRKDFKETPGGISGSQFLSVDLTAQTRCHPPLRRSHPNVIVTYITLRNNLLSYPEGILNIFYSAKYNGQINYSVGQSN
jgi:hypothetical protein